MSSQGISRQILMTRVDTNTSRFNRTPRNSSVFLGEAIILLSASYLSDGEQVSIYIITLVLSSPVLRDLWAHLFRSILMTDMWASCRTKSSPQPSTFVKFLCFISDSVSQAFLVPVDKKGKFKTLREELLGSSFAPVLELASFRRKSTIS